MEDITKKWTGHRQIWGKIHSQLEIFFEEKIGKVISRMHARQGFEPPEVLRNDVNIIIGYGRMDDPSQ